MIRFFLNIAIYCLPVLILCSNLNAQDPFWQLLEKGPYEVGFKADTKYDYSRTFKPKYNLDGNLEKGERARPIQISIWYPANPDPKQTRMLYQNYVHLIALEKGPQELNDSIRKAAVEEMISWGIQKEKLETHLQNNTLAYKDAQPVDGRFPLIIYGSSWSSSSFENDVLCEYLASHGYVVISSPSMGQYTRGMTGDLSGVEAQVQDMQYLINYIHDLPFVDPEKIGVAGFSWGGLTNVFLQMRNNKVEAVVSYDGSIANRNGRQLCQESALCDEDMMTVPFMYMSQKGRKQNPFYDSLLYSDAYNMVFHNNSHIDFASMFIKVVSGNTDEKREQQKLSSYSLQCLYTLKFFEAYLKGDQKSLLFLKKKENHAEHKAVFSFESKQGIPPPPSQAQFEEILDRDGIEKAEELFVKIRKSNPSYQLFKESSLNSKGYALLKSGKTNEAIRVFKLNTIAFPASSNVFDSLGDAYSKAGQTEKAIECYEKALANDPENGSSRKKLDNLLENIDSN